MKTERKGYYNNQNNENALKKVKSHWTDDGCCLLCVDFLIIIVYIFFCIQTCDYNCVAHV